METSNLDEAAALEARAAELCAQVEKASLNPPAYQEACELRTQARFRRRLANGENVHPDMIVSIAELLPNLSGRLAVHVAAETPHPEEVAPSPGRVATPQPKASSSPSAGAPSSPAETAHVEIEAAVARILASDGPAETDDSDSKIAALARSIADSDLEGDHAEIGALAKQIEAS